MKKYKKIAIYILFIGIISVLVGSSYAFFNYTRTGATSTLIVGNIYMNHTQGTAINLIDEFPEKKEVARERNDNSVTIQVTGYNDSEKDIYYKLMLNHGDEVVDRTRIADQFLRFDLIEILPNNEERYIVYNENFDTINNTILVKDRIDAGTSSSASVTRTYQLRMWISDDILISDTDLEANYTTDEYEELFASVKITVKGDTEDVYYYSSFDDAITAINSGTYASNTTRSLAKAGIYIDSDDNSTNLVLYDDIDASTYFEINEPVNINLYGYSVNDIATERRAIGFEVYANSTISNGVINSRANGNGHNFYFYTENADLVINNIETHSLLATLGDVDYTTGIQADTSSNIIMKNSNVDLGVFVSARGGKLTTSNVEANGTVRVVTNSTTELNDSKFYNQNKYLADIYSNATLKATNTKIFSDSPGCYIGNNGAYFNDSVGIINRGTLIFNSGYVFGTNAAVTTYSGSKTYVYGGTFESTDHGGFYFAHGASGVAYIENANIGGINYPAEGRLRPNGKVNTIEVDGATYNIEEVQAAYYMGDGPSYNGEELYIVNSNLYADGGEFIIMKSSTPQQSMYFSGTKFINTRTGQHFRMQNFDSMRLYLGVGNDFGLVNTVYNNGSNVSFDVARAAGAIIDTNVDYKGIVSPE